MAGQSYCVEGNRWQWGWCCHVSCVGGDKGAGIAYHKHNDDDVIVVVPHPSVLHGHHVADCDMAQLTRGVVRGPGPWHVPVVIFGVCWSSFVSHCMWLSFVVGHSRSFVVLLPCRARWWWVEESNSNILGFKP